MARRTWTIEVSVDSGQNWTNDGTIYRPNENLSLDLTSTQIKIRLANGDNAFITPETKYNKEPMTLRWLELTESEYSSFNTKIRNYVINQNYLQITDHNNDTYEGRFVSIRRVWLSGVEDCYDIEAIFERMN